VPNRWLPRWERWLPLAPLSEWRGVGVHCHQLTESSISYRQLDHRHGSRSSCPTVPTGHRRRAAVGSAHLHGSGLGPPAYRDGAESFGRMLKAATVGNPRASLEVTAIFASAVGPEEQGIAARNVGAGPFATFCAFTI
jgi:hypothetical protein